MKINFIFFARTTVFPCTTRQKQNVKYKFGLDILEGMDREQFSLFSLPFSPFFFLLVLPLSPLSLPFSPFCLHSSALPFSSQVSVLLSPCLPLPCIYNLNPLLFENYILLKNIHGEKCSEIFQFALLSHTNTKTYHV